MTQMEAKQRIQEAPFEKINERFRACRLNPAEAAA